MEMNGLYLAEGTMLDNRYIVKKVLGAGGFGVTYLAFDNLNQFVCAIKEYLPRDVSVRENTLRVTPAADRWKDEFEHGRKRFIEEADTLRKLSGYKSIVKITDYFDENNTSYFVMEYIDGVNLNTLRKSLGGKIPYQYAVDIICQVCDGLEALHVREGILHRDISPENIMIMQDGKVKLIDFGNARNFSIQKGFSIVLKQGFAPIEQYSSSGKQGTYTDVYSLAVTLYYILSGVMPPNAVERQEGIQYVSLKNLNLDIPAYISDAIDHALKIKYYDRIQTVGELKGRLQEKKTVEKSLKKQKKITPYFEIIKGENAGKKHIIPVNTILQLGRSTKASDICIGNDLRMSRVHCRLFYDTTNELFYLEDCSENGVYVDGKSLSPGIIIPLEANKSFVIGNHICEIEVGVSYE